MKRPGEGSQRCGDDRSHSRPRTAAARPATAAAIALAVACAACGSYTRRDYIARADAICANALRATRSVAVGAGASASATDPRGLAGYLRQALPIVEAEATGLHALRRPADDARDRALLTRYLRAVSQTTAEVRRLAAAAEHGDPRGVAGAEAALRTSPVASLAGAYGLRTCGASGTTVG